MNISGEVMPARWNWLTIARAAWATASVLI